MTAALTQPLWPDTAKQIGLSKNSIYEAAARGELPFVRRVGRRYLVSRAHLHAWLSANDDAPGTADPGGAKSSAQLAADEVDQ